MALPVFDRVARRFGLWRTVIVFLALYCVPSIWAAAAPNLTALMVVRIFQGLCAGIIQPGSLTALYVAITIEWRAIERRAIERRGLGCSLFSFATAAVAVTAPWIGGMLADSAGWRSVFLAFGVPRGSSDSPGVDILSCDNIRGLPNADGLGWPWTTCDEPVRSILELHCVATWGGDMPALLFAMIGPATGFYLFWQREAAVPIL